MALNISARYVPYAVRVGMPKTVFDMPVTLKSPVYATGYVFYCLRSPRKELCRFSERAFCKRMLSSMKSWSLISFEFIVRLTDNQYDDNNG
jgi:hypothetical protein